MKKILIMICAVAAGVAACSKSGEEQLDSQRVAISLTSGVDAQLETKAAFGLDDKLREGNMVNVLIDNASTDAEIYNKYFTVGANGELTEKNSATLFFPEGRSTVNIYAVHPATDDELVLDQPITHSVQTDQTTEENYAASDLSFARVIGQSSTANAVELQFEHLCSKLEVAVRFEGVEAEISNIEILNTKTEAQFTPSKSEEIILTATDNTEQEIGILTDETTDTNNPLYNEAIVIPQTIAQGTELVKITAVDGRTWVYTPSEDLEFEAGRKRRLRLMIDDQGAVINIISQLEDWGEDEDATVSDGIGPEDVIFISTPEDLQNIKDDLDAHYVLTKDLDMSGVDDWQLLGPYEEPFSGTLDGNGCEISNFTCHKTGAEAALFGYIEEGTVKNLTMSNVNISGSFAAAIARACYDGSSLENCRVLSGEIEGTDAGASTGGLVAGANGEESSPVRISSCYNAAKIVGVGTRDGGIVGSGDDLIITNTKYLSNDDINTDLPIVGFYSPANVIIDENSYSVTAPLY